MFTKVLLTDYHISDWVLVNLKVDNFGGQKIVKVQIYFSHIQFFKKAIALSIFCAPE